MATLLLRIDPLAPEAGWRAHWSAEGRPVGAGFAVTGPAAEALAGVSQRFLALFEGETRPLVDPEGLRALGAELYRLWWEPATREIAAALSPGGNDLVISSADRRVLNLPWELMERLPGLPLGCDAAWSVRRLPVVDGAETMVATEPPLRAGPLRILFLAAAPVDQPQLDYEREEDAMLRATAGLRGNVMVHFAETGTIEELAQLVARCRPHIVHLSGHGNLDGEGNGVFAFEDEDGRTDPREAREIAAEVTRGGSVRLMLLNACKTSQAAAAGLCQSLAAAGVPLALGWAASVEDGVATKFASALYARLLAGEPVPAAVAHARLAIQEEGGRRGEGRLLQDASFALPQIYGGSARGDLYDRRLPPEPYDGPRTEYALLGEGIRGLREGFIGRRREVQKLLPPLRRGDATMAVLTGIGGAGKSTLATRAANRLEAEGFQVVPVRVQPAESPAMAARMALSHLIDALERAFLKEQREDLRGLLTNGQIRLEQRLRLAVEGLNELALVLVLDNFEDALDLGTRRIADPDLAAVYRRLAMDLTRGSRVIVTCRYLPAEVATVLHLPLPDFQEHDIRKFLQREPKVEERLHKGEIPQGLFDRLCRELGGTPGFLGMARALLKTVDAEELLDDLDGVAPGTLAAEREAYYARVFVGRLYEALSGPAQRVVSRLAVSELPLPVDAVARIAGIPAPVAEESLNTCVAYGLVQPFFAEDLPTLFHPPGLLRPWLCATERLPDAEANAVHRDLATFWKESFEGDRERELRVSIDAELEACRLHARRAEEIATLRWATVRRARGLKARSDWRMARQLLEEIAVEDRDAESWMELANLEIRLGDWKEARGHLGKVLQVTDAETLEESLALHQLATIDLNEGKYSEARDKFSQALKIRQDIGNRAGVAATLHQLATINLEVGRYPEARAELNQALKINQDIGNREGVAGTLHQLASIDLEEGKYPEARDKFNQALKINQDIGNRTTEAATFSQLGSLAYRTDRKTCGATLLAICWLIDRSIGHGETEGDFQALSTWCRELGFDQARFDALIQEALREYKKDRGHSLIERTFADEPAPKPTSPPEKRKRPFWKFWGKP